MMIFSCAKKLSVIEATLEISLSFASTLKLCYSYTIMQCSRYANLRRCCTPLNMPSPSPVMILDHKTTILVAKIDAIQDDETRHKCM